MTLPEATFTVRPTLKPAIFALLFACCFIAVCYWAFFRYVPAWPSWVPLLSFLSLLPAALSWLDAQRTSLALAGQELRLRSGIFSRTTRSLDLRMVHSARAERALLQRLWNVGSLVVESDRAEARLAIRDIDAPASYAKIILAAAERARNPLPSEPSPRQTQP